MNVIARLEYELSYYDSAVDRVNHFTTKTPPKNINLSVEWMRFSKFYSPEFGPCDFWLFPKLRSGLYETFEEMKETVTKVIDTLTQEDFHEAFQKLLERYKCIAAGWDYFEGD